jgi:hypothetical protein
LSTGPENKLRGQVYRYLRKEGYFYFPIVGGPRQVRGIPDIIVVIDGKFIGIELKAGKNKQSEWQVRFEEKIKKAGGYYYVIHSISELKEALSEHPDPAP